eukprot:scaffold1768_cov116-Isochrysis_galbana.AAC.5
MYGEKSGKRSKHPTTVIAAVNDACSKDHRGGKTAGERIDRRRHWSSGQEALDRVGHIRQPVRDRLRANIEVTPTYTDVVRATVAFHPITF